MSIHDVDTFAEQLVKDGVAFPHTQQAFVELARGFLSQRRMLQCLKIRLDHATAAGVEKWPEYLELKERFP